MRLNAIRIRYAVRRHGRFVQIRVPDHYRRRVEAGKYILTVVGLLSAFIIFNSVWTAFLFGLATYLITLLLEKTIFGYTAIFIHALPDFELDQEKWVGVVFGFTGPPDGSFVIPLVGPTLTDPDLARQLDGLLLNWSYGERDDVDGNIVVSVVMDGDDYIFYCYPSMKRQGAVAAFDRARRELKETSLTDVVLEHHGMLVLGKRCRVLPGSYFPLFQRKYRAGIPVWLQFFVPPFDEGPQTLPDLAPFVIHDFRLRKRSELTRKDLEFDLVRRYTRDDPWQGPPQLAP